jgi:hypothetical protein
MWVERWRRKERRCNERDIRGFPSHTPHSGLGLGLQKGKTPKKIVPTQQYDIVLTNTRKDTNEYRHMEKEKREEWR